MYYGAYPPYPQTGEPQGATPPGPVPWPPQGYVQPVPQEGVSGTSQEASQGPAPCGAPPAAPGWVPQGQIFQGQAPQAGAPQGPVPYGAPPAAPGWVPQGQVFQGQAPQAGAPQGPAPYGAPPAVPGWVPPSGYQPAAYPMVIPACDPRKRGASSTINRMGLLLLAQVALSFIWQFPLQMLLALVGVDLFQNALGYQWLSGVLVPLSTALPFAAYLFFRKQDPSDYLKFEKVGFTSGLLCVAAGLGVVLLGNYPAMLVQQFLGNFGYESPGSILSQGESLEAILLEIAVTAVLVPFMEEFAFRGVILSALRRYGIGFSIVVSGVLFGLAHLDASSVVFATIAGLVFGFLYAKTNNLWLTVIVHALNNLIAVLGSHGEFLFGSQANLVGNLIMLVPIGVGVVALVLLLCLKRKMFISVGSPRYDGPAQPLRAGESAGALVRAPVFWVVVGLMVLYTVGIGILL